MKKLLRILVPLLLAVLILASVWWYLFQYDRSFTRDMLLEQARFQDLHGNTRLSAWFYDMAYEFSGRDENVAIELANQYIGAGNYTKAEATLSNAIHTSATVELYTALSKVYVEQDKLMDADALLNGIADPQLHAQLEAMRPAAPEASYEPGFYSQYISVALTAPSGTIYCTENGEYPSVGDPPYAQPIELEAGETVITAVSVGENGLVSSPVTLGYTVGGVIEPAVFMEPSVEIAIREQLGFASDKILYTNQLWAITEFTYPEDVTCLDDLHLMPYLNSLTVKNIAISDITPLSGLASLNRLDLTGCSLPSSAVETIAALPELRELTLSDCSLSTIAGMEQAQKLTYLDISSNTVRNLEPLSQIITLTELNMGHNALTALDAISGLTALQKLDVSYNSITSLSPVGNLLRLTALDASHNQIAAVEGIPSLSVLENLALDYNALTDISDLGGNVSLVNLTVSNNALTDISALNGLTNLEVFNFSYNQITALPGWSSDSHLRIIDGSYNQLESLEPLRGMGDLTFVSMDYNALTSVDCLESCYNLVQVNVYGNEIGEVSALTDQDIIVNYNPTV